MPRICARLPRCSALERRTEYTLNEASFGEFSRRSSIHGSQHAQSFALLVERLPISEVKERDCKRHGIEHRHLILFTHGKVAGLREARGASSGKRVAIVRAIWCLVRALKVANASRTCAREKQRIGIPFSAASASMPAINSPTRALWCERLPA